MTLDELANSKAYEWGNQDEFIEIERLKLHIIAARATIIQRRYDQTKIFPQSIIMTLKCQDIIKVSSDECGCESNGKDDIVYRSLHKIPNPIIVKDDSYFIFVGNTKGVVSFSYLRPEEVQDVKYRKFSKHEQFYTYKNGYLYFFNPLIGFSARYVPENPLAVLSLGECEIGCVTDGELILEDSLVEGIIGLLERRRKDLVNNNKNNTEEVIIDAND